MGNNLLLLHENRRIDYSFLGGSLPGPLSFSRASAAKCINSAGMLVDMASDAPRFDVDPSTLAMKGLLIEPQQTNLLLNNTMLGAVAGTPGSPPTNWKVTAGGLTSSIVGVGLSNGINFVDINVNGTTTSTVSSIFFQYSGGTIVVGPNAATSLSAFVACVGGSLANISSILLGWDEFNTGGSYVCSRSTPMTPGPAIARFGQSLVTSATTYRVNPYIYLMTSTGVSINVTLRVGLPQIELGSSVTSPIATTGVQCTRAADSLSFMIPRGCSTLRYLFDNNTTQTASVTNGSYTVPTNLNRPWIKEISIS